MPHIASAITQTEDQAYSIDADNFIEDYRGALTSVLQDAAEEIQDDSLAGFYQQLLQEYGLDQADQEKPSSDTSLEEALPDIKKIHGAAMKLPLQEAGKTIRDEDLARFYHDFVKSAGWEIESD